MNAKIVVHEAAGGLLGRGTGTAGCASQGDTMDELLANMREAIQAWFEAEEPEPASAPERRVVELQV